MAQRSGAWIANSALQVCRRCKVQSHRLRSSILSSRAITTSSTRSQDADITAAPEIDFSSMDETPARIVPASPSYFTAAPALNDDLLLLQSLVERYQAIPTVSAEDAAYTPWLRLAQYRSGTGEKVGAAKYAKVVALLTRLSRIHPKLQPQPVRKVIQRFIRPGAAEQQKAKPGRVDEHGRSFGFGRRKESNARVYLVEGTGQVLINGKNITQALPRLHDRESALWALKVSERTDKYNVFAKVQGGGHTGQAESVTLAVARALLVHEPALKPVLRRAGCITFDIRKVERKKPGRLKARKRPAWVKR